MFYSVRFEFWMFVRWFRFCFSNLTLIPLRWLNKCYSLVSLTRWAPLYFSSIIPPLFLITRGIKTKKSFIFIIAIVKQTSSKWKYTDSSRNVFKHGDTTSKTSPPSLVGPPSPDWLEFKFQVRDSNFSKSRVDICRGQLKIGHFLLKTNIFIRKFVIESFLWAVFSWEF